ncbi:MAG: DUF4167 domain-containing protein [Pseudomonadota bacterium]
MNNRQAGRRRGRNNNSNRNNNRGGGGIDRENRIDNRARGNAAQMLDKYKKMAQDAQVNGDRVNAEYYHQFADHYFRVNADSQARREEQRQAREEARGNSADRNEAGDEGEQERRPSRGRQQRDNRKQDGQKPAGQEQDAAVSEDLAEEKKPVRSRRPRKAANGDASEGNGEANGLDASALPPAISVGSDDSDAGEAVDEKPAEKPVRKRRTVKPKAEEGDAA